jgi:hypothetical protein
VGQLNFFSSILPKVSIPASFIFGLPLQPALKFFQRELETHLVFFSVVVIKVHPLPVGVTIYMTFFAHDRNFPSK